MKTLEIKNILKTKQKNIIITELIIFSLILIFFKLILLIDLGDLIVFNSLITNPQIICILNIFKPPVVDPEQPPINIMIKNIVFAKFPQFEKFSVE